MRTRDENKENLVKEKALEMLVKEGFDGFSMHKLAKAANVSPATLYIYYQDKEDLIVQLGIEEGRKMTQATMKGFSPTMPFAEGLRIQWRNRANYLLANNIPSLFFEQIKHSPYRERIMSAIIDEFKEIMKSFTLNAIENHELIEVPLEVYWSIAFAPLYNLIRFHQEGKSIGGRDFVWNEEYFELTLTLVLKALKP